MPWLKSATKAGQTANRSVSSSDKIWGLFVRGRHLSKGNDLWAALVFKVVIPSCGISEAPAWYMLIGFIRCDHVQSLANHNAWFILLVGEETAARYHVWSLLQLTQISAALFSWSHDAKWNSRAVLVCGESFVDLHQSASWLLCSSRIFYQTTPWIVKFAGSQVAAKGSWWPV